MKVRWVRPAIADLEAIGDAVAAEDPEEARRLVARILAHADTLGQHAHVGRSGRLAGTREFRIPGTPFVVAYHPHEETIEVLAIFHGARIWPPPPEPAGG